MKARELGFILELMTADGSHTPPIDDGIVLVKDNKIRHMDRGMYWILNLDDWNAKLPDFSLYHNLARKFSTYLTKNFCEDEEVKVSAKFPTVTFEISNVKITLPQAGESGLKSYQNDSEIILKPVLTNSFFAEISVSQLREFLDVCEFSSSRNVWIKFDGDQLTLSSSGVTYTATAENSTISPGWNTLLSLDDIKRICHSYRGVCTLQVSVNENSTKAVVFNDASLDTGLSVVLMPLISAPIS